MARDDITPATFSVAETANYLGISPSGVRRAIKDGAIPAVTLGGRVLVLRQQLVIEIARAVGRGEEFDQADAEQRDEESRGAAYRTEWSEAAFLAENGPPPVGWEICGEAKNEAGQVIGVIARRRWADIEADNRARKMAEAGKVPGSDPRGIRRVDSTGVVRIAPEQEYLH
jgi:excisionase family DNA binding protein